MIKNLVFDFGGVIIKSSVQKAIGRFEEIGLKDAYSHFSSFVQQGIFGELEGGLISGDEFLTELGKMCGKPITIEAAEYAWQGYYVSIDLDRLDFIMNLRAKGYKAYLMSNTNPFMMSWANSTDFTERHQPLSYYFDKLYLSYQIKLMKPSLEIYDYFLRDANASALECSFIDDGLANVISAEHRGFFTINPENGADWRPQLTDLLQKDGAYPL